MADNLHWPLLPTWWWIVASVVVPRWWLQYGGQSSLPLSSSFRIMNMAAYPCLPFASFLWIRHHLFIVFTRVSLARISSSSSSFLSSRQSRPRSIVFLVVPPNSIPNRPSFSGYLFLPLVDSSFSTTHRNYCQRRFGWPTLSRTSCLTTKSPSSLFS